VRTQPDNGLYRIGTALALYASIAGCATSNVGGIPSVREGQAAVVAGKSTKADVEAALGTALVVGFDSGYEVWVYREAGSGQGFGWFGQPAAEKAELVILFEPSGVVGKSRIRAPAVRKGSG
jgi:hypothetical protein